MKAIALLSGGLDSILAIKLIKDQGIDVLALNFTSPFCTCTKKGSSCSAAFAAAKQLNVPLKVIAKGLDYFKIVENPKFGYGSAMNPCIDCRIYILKRAKEVMEEEGASFLISGEVLNQRPMSQRRDTLRLIEREAGVEGLLLRPLSAKLLPETLPEKRGWVDRSKLLAISGRGRKEQIEIATKSNLDYPCPAGGCLLTDKNIAKRLKDLFTYKKDYNLDDIKLLKIGRHIRLNEREKVIIARNEEEGNKLLSYFDKDHDILFQCVEPKGPVALIKDSNSSFDKKVFSLIYRYSDAKGGQELLITTKGVVDSQFNQSACEISEDELKRMII